MPETKKSFDIKVLKILDEKGHCDEKSMPKISEDMIKKMYESMVLTRVFDDTCLKLQREGRIGTYASTLGQEASNIGVGLALEKDDWVFPSFREHGVYISKGVNPSQMFLMWGGDERANGSAENKIFTMSIPVSTHIPHAAGAGYAFRVQKKKSVSVAIFGDGATSKGDFHEGLNFAGVRGCQTVFVCQNNQWAISVPFSHQTAAETAAQKAIAYGIHGIRADGNDVFAVYKAMREALENARKGKPSLVECLTYRMSDHTTSDDWTKYRDPKDVAEWKKKDPILRLQLYMKSKKMWNAEYEKKILDDAHKKIDAAVKEFEAVTEQPVENIFQYMYAEMPNELKEQMEELKSALGDSNSKTEHGTSN